MSLFRRKAEMVDSDSALPGRSTRMPLAAQHFVLSSPLTPPFPAGTVEAQFGMGCFWGAERLFWKIPGVVSTSVGYAGGYTPNPSYEEVCSGETGHLEAVEIRYDSTRISYGQLLDVFWQNIDPTDAWGQFADQGSQYQTAVFCHTAEQAAEARASLAALAASGTFERPLVTQIREAAPFYPAEDHHQDYYLKQPQRYQGYKEGSGRAGFLRRIWGGH